jgi:hypothetical protein
MQQSESTKLQQAEQQQQLQRGEASSDLMAAALFSLQGLKTDPVTAVRPGSVGYLPFERGF